MREVSSAAVIGMIALAPACVNDVVLPNQEVTAVCGNGVLEPGEACDVASPGCVACVVAPTWKCTRDGCTSTCGDGVIGSDAACSSPRREAACEMTGYWAARQSTSLRESILNGLQVSSNWFLFRFAQEGEGFRVTEALDCGIFVTGNATVRYTPASLRAIIQRSGMDGKSGHPARRGTSRAMGGGCAFSFDRWYAVRGVGDSFLPSDFVTKPDLASLPPLPTVKDPGSSNEIPAGTLDADGDGFAGLAFQIEGLVSGVRNSAQRDWKEFATPSGATVPANALAFDVPGAFDLQESVLHVSECGTGCGLLASVARVAQDIPARFTFAYIGKELGGPRVQQVVRGAPGANIGDDLATCANIRVLLPHDSGQP